MLDLGDPWVGQILVTSDGSTAADPTAISVTITLPDGTSTSPTPTHLGTGSYQATYTSTQLGRHTVYWHATGVNESAVDDMFEIRPSISLSLLSLDEARRAVGMSKTINDEELRDYMDAVTSLIEGEIGPVIPRSVTEVVSAGQAIRLTSTPVNSVTSITGYQAGAWQVVPSNTLFDPVTGVVQLYNRVGFYDQYTVVYNAGRGMTPSIKQAARVLLQHLWANQRGNAPTRDADAYTSPFTMPNAVREALNWLRTPAVG